MEKFRCVVADPPWSYSDKMLAMQTTGNGAAGQYRCLSIAEIANFVDDIKFRCVLADPPWPPHPDRSQIPNTKSNTARGTRDVPYHVMPVEEIADLAIADYIADDAHLWLWVTNAFLIDGTDAHVARSWDFEPKTVATWIKGRLVVQPFDGGVSAEMVAAGDGRVAKLVNHIGQGHYLRNSTEHCIFAVRGSCPPLVRNLPTAFIYPGRWPGRRHSEKPPIIHEWAEQMSSGPYLELFARSQRKGWAAVGDELPTTPTAIVPSTSTVHDVQEDW